MLANHWRQHCKVGSCDKHILILVTDDLIPLTHTYAYCFRFLFYRYDDTSQLNCSEMPSYPNFFINMRKSTKSKALLKSNNERTTDYLLLNALKVWFIIFITAVVVFPCRDPICVSDKRCWLSKKIITDNA